jgi:hypothetical protein
VGELPGVGGNKVFQVVTPARQGFAGFFAVPNIFRCHFYRRVQQRTDASTNRHSISFATHRQTPAPWAFRRADVIKTRIACTDANRIGIFHPFFDIEAHKMRCNGSLQLFAQFNARCMMVPFARPLI